MNSYIFHITLYDLFIFGMIFTGWVFCLFLWLVKSINRSANRFLALALLAMTLWMLRILHINLPEQMLLTVGPLLYLYVLKITQREYQFKRRDLLHLSPLAFVVAPTSVLQILIFVSVMAYLYLADRLIQKFYKGLQPVLMDRSLLEFRWLRRLLGGTAMLWVLWIVSESGLPVYGSVYIFFAVMIIWTAAAAFLRPQAGITKVTPVIQKTVPSELKQKSTWLKKMMESNNYYLDPELSLTSMAEKLGLTTHELSHIVNTGLKKSFADFVNAYRVRDAAAKMQDPEFDHLTLLGIAYESGFNSQRTFNRAFKDVTGKTPLEYKNDLKKVLPYDKMAKLPASPPLILRILNRNYMFRNYLKIAWRHLTSNKLYSTINVMGLALGICACLVIYLITSFEFSFDTFHPDKERIYCVDVSVEGNPDPDHAHWNAVPAPMPDAMRSEMSGFEKVAAFQHYNPKVKIKEGEKVVKTFDQTNGIIPQPDYFDILPYTWLSGSKRTSLSKPMTVVLTQSRAKTYFGDLQPDEMIGKTVTYDDSLTVTVTGILQDWNKNSDFDFSEFISFSTINSSFLKNQVQLDNWFNLDHGSQELVKLPAGVDPSQIDKQFPAFIRKHLDPNPHTKTHAQLQPFTGIHFHREYGGEGNKADMRILYTLAIVALFILFIAAINFINLATAQSMQRTKEIGIRKVLGSGKRAILLQFLTETFMLALLAVAMAATAIRPVLDLFAAYIPQGVKFDLTNYVNWVFLAGIAVFTTLLAGLYPAKLLTTFQPVSSLKGKTNEKSANKGYLRKSLIVFQFTMSLIFMTCTIVMSKQINYMQTRELGFKTSNIITLRSLWSDHTGKMKVLAEKIKQLPGVDQVITEAFPPMGFAHMGNGAQLHGSAEKPFEVSVHSGNENFVPFYHMKIIAGRNLLPSDSVREYLINETAAKALGFNKPQKAIGRLLLLGNKPYPIAGVVADFYENSFHQQIMPVVIENDPKVQMGIALKLTPAEFQKGDIPLLVKRIAKQWKNVFPEEPFDYSFLGDYITRLYEMDQRMQWTMKIATIITIFISCIGLFGLTMFNTERRTKEISIRKVLGATAGNILTMLNTEIIILIVISFLISSPIAWLFAHKMLQNFAYHTNLSVWVFILAGAGALLIALATISFQTIRSAAANPVKGLRNE